MKKSLAKEPPVPRMAAELLWGRWDDVTINLRHIAHGPNGAHRWEVYLPQAKVAVYGEPNDPDLNKYIAVAIAQGEAKEPKPQ